MRRTLLLAVAIAGVVPSLAVAQTLDEIIDKHLAARGGVERLQAVRSIRMTGRAVAGPGREALITREILRPNRMRTEFTFQGVTDVFVFDGERGWYVSPSTGVFNPQPMSPDDLRFAREQATIEGPFAGWRTKGHRVELVGKDAIDGREAYRIRTTLTGGTVRDDYIDAQSFQIVRTDMPRRLRGQTIQVQSSFSDYRETDGFWFPRTIVSTATGRPQSLTIKVESIEINPPLDESQFK